MISSCQVLCRCKKVLTTYRDWVTHLKTRHPKFYEELKADGTLAEDKAIFRQSLERE